MKRSEHQKLYSEVEEKIVTHLKKLKPHIRVCAGELVTLLLGRQGFYWPDSAEAHPVFGRRAMMRLVRQILDDLEHCWLVEVEVRKTTYSYGYNYDHITRTAPVYRWIGEDDD